MLLCFEFLAAQLRARFGTGERGAILVEYALLVALVAVACVVAVTTMAKTVKSKFTLVGNSILNG